MLDPLEDARYTLARARHHVAEFRVRVESFASRQPYRFVLEVDPDTGRQVGRVALVEPMPDELPAIFADAIHNLRVSLDHAAHACAPGRRNADFPFGATLPDVMERRDGSSKDLPPKVFDAILGLKPYREGNHPLWAVNKIDNSGKHRGLVRVTPTYPDGRLQLLGKQVLAVGSLELNPETNEMELVEITKGSDAYFEIEAAPFVEIGDVEGVQPGPAATLLYEMVRQVEGSLRVISRAAQGVPVRSDYPDRGPDAST